jgi:predicted nucleic acid-binding protein
VIVLDSSAAVDYLLGLEPEATWVADRLAGHEGDIHAPHLIDTEVMTVVRRFVREHALTAENGLERVRAMSAFPIRRYPHTELTERVWALRERVASNDGFFVALAEALDAPLVTTDRRLARVKGIRVPILAP